MISSGSLLFSATLDNPAAAAQMRRLSTPALAHDHTESLLMIGAMASGASDIATRAHDVLEMIKGIVPYAAASISGWDAIQDRHFTIANLGYPEEVRTYLDEEFVREDQLYQLMRRKQSGPLRWADTPFDYRQHRSAKDVFMPAGFDEGFSACLYSSDSRYTGVLHLSVHDKRDLSEPAMGAATWLQRLLAPLADQLEFMSDVSLTINPHASAILVSQAGPVVEVPGSLREGRPDEVEPLIERVRNQWTKLRSRTMGSWLWRVERDKWFSIQIIAVAQGLLVMYERAAPPYGLTFRELQVVAAIIDGSTNTQIGRLLGLSSRTVAKHVENVMAKNWGAISDRACYICGHGRFCDALLMLRRDATGVTSEETAEEAAETDFNQQARV